MNICQISTWIQRLSRVVTIVKVKLLHGSDLGTRTYRLVTLNEVSGSASQALEILLWKFTKTDLSIHF